MTSPAQGAAPAPAPLRLLFIHHSVGGQLLADEGPRSGGETRESGEYCIYVSHPYGGGLRRRLEATGYEVHEASYGSRVGDKTDIRDWGPKFANQMEEILRVDRQDRQYPGDERNRIVVFKSCFPNNAFVGAGTPPGDPTVPQLTVANAQAAYRALLPLFQARPEVLFVAFTAPPLAERKPVGLKAKLKAFLQGTPRAGRHARAFNTWLTDRQGGWLAGYPLANVVVFDYYDLLTAHGASDWLAYPTGGGRDSHPSAEGQRRAAEAFVPFLDKAVEELGLRREQRPGNVAAPSSESDSGE